MHLNQSYSKQMYLFRSEKCYDANLHIEFSSSGSNPFCSLWNLESMEHVLNCPTERTVRTMSENIVPREVEIFSSGSNPFGSSWNLESMEHVLNCPTERTLRTMSEKIVPREVEILFEFLRLVKKFVDEAVAHPSLSYGKTSKKSVPQSSQKCYDANLHIEFSSSGSNPFGSSWNLESMEHVLNCPTERTLRTMSEKIVPREKLQNRVMAVQAKKLPVSEENKLMTAMKIDFMSKTSFVDGSGFCTGSDFGVPPNPFLSIALLVIPMVMMTIMSKYY
ncbi:unnamed protein product [Mytilus coruscus]|uniref:Uncharacterized protein n=1 Tax=Mytilus coruscus TaxID=42192 RepID=A0A6J8DLC1_MYTCO|nr:unnamed protein product [Mytilus coruscus]